MATIRRRGDKYEVQIRRIGQPHVSKTFHQRKDAQAWARTMEVQADRNELPADRKALTVTLGELVARYRDTVSIRKKTATAERLVLAAFGLHPICRKRISELRAADFATYRDERLKAIKPVSLKRELVPIRNLFVIARTRMLTMQIDQSPAQILRALMANVRGGPTCPPDEDLSRWHALHRHVTSGSQSVVVPYEERLLSCLRGPSFPIPNN